METEETAEIMECRSHDNDGVATIVDDGTCNEGERTVGGRD